MTAIYLVIAYRQLFGYSWWGTLWRCVVTFTTAMLTMVPLLIIGFWFGTDDRTDAVMDATPWVLALIGIAIAILLIVTWRISWHTSKKEP